MRYRGSRGPTQARELAWATHHQRPRDFSVIGLGILGRPADGLGMKTVSERIKKRLRKDRQMITISIRMPKDLVEELKEIAPTVGFSGYQPLIRAYIGQGLRKDLATIENSQMHLLTQSLRKHGISDQVISAAMIDAELM